MAATSAEPWYIHAVLYVIIAVLVVVLVKVAIIDPETIVKQENFYRTESRTRMKDIKEAEILWEKINGKFTDNMDSLVNFVKTSPVVDSVMNAMDTLNNKSLNPFLTLSNGKFTPDSLYKTPKSHKPYILQIDSSASIDTVVNRFGKIIRVDTNRVMGTMYYVEDPDGYGTIGSTKNLALKNTVSWE